MGPQSRDTGGLDANEDPDDDRRPVRDPAATALLEAARSGDRAALARLLTLVENGGERGRAAASTSYLAGGEVTTIGITGAPGSGKSTLVDRLVGVARSRGVEKLGVLAVDPTSPFSGGAILGDRVRMQDHALDPGVFIRSMATRGHLGGLALAVPEAIGVLAAAGTRTVIVETVGVGQVEVEVASQADATVVVVNPGWGDSVQANKAGLLEIADIFVINKAERPGTRETRRDLEQMLEMGYAGEHRPAILETVASTGEGIEPLWDAIVEHREHLASRGLLELRRRERVERELRRVLVTRIEVEVERLVAADGFGALADAVVAREIDPYAAADEILDSVLARVRSAHPRDERG